MLVALFLFTHKKLFFIYIDASNLHFILSIQSNEMRKTKNYSDFDEQ